MILQTVAQTVCPTPCYKNMAGYAQPATVMTTTIRRKGTNDEEEWSTHNNDNTRQWWQQRTTMHDNG